MIDQYTKFGSLKPHQVDETRFDIQKTVRGTGLVQLGRSKGLHGRADDADWHPTYVKPADLP